MSETVTTTPAPVAAPAAAPARTARTLAEATRNAMAADYAPDVASGDAAPAAPALPADPMAQIASAAAITEAAARGEEPPAPEGETPEGEAEPAEDPKAEAVKPDFGLVKHFRAKAESETQARIRAEAEVSLLRDQLQQVVEYLQQQKAQPAAPQAAAEPEVEEDYGDPALQQLAAMRREMAKFKALEAELDAIKQERETEKLSAKASAIEADLRKDWESAKGKYPVLGNREHAGKLWDMVKANPGLTVEDAAIILQHRFGESRPGPVPARAPVAQPAPVAAPSRPAPPRPPPGGAAAVVAPAIKIRTLEEARRAAMNY